MNEKPIKPETIGPGERESQYLLREYSAIELESASMTAFLSEVLATLESRIHGFGPATSVLDMGCGRGYLLEHMRRKGYENLSGIDPCAPLVENRIFDGVRMGGFEGNGLSEGGFDVVLSCHTLHHLPDSHPVAAVGEMLRLSRGYIAIVEINNTNLPMLAVSALHWRVERNAFRYNRAKARSLVLEAGGIIIYEADLRSCYVSSGSLPYRLMSMIGTRPYNIVIGRKTA